MGITSIVNGDNRMVCGDKQTVGHDNARNGADKQRECVPREPGGESPGGCRS